MPSFLTMLYKREAALQGEERFYGCLLHEELEIFYKAGRKFLTV